MNTQTQSTKCCLRKGCYESSKRRRVCDDPKLQARRQIASNVARYHGIKNKRTLYDRREWSHISHWIWWTPMVTREPAIVYFHKKYWFNVIAMIREKGVSYYCNLASPFAGRWGLEIYRLWLGYQGISWRRETTIGCRWIWDAQQNDELSERYWLHPKRKCEDSGWLDQ